MLFIRIFSLTVINLIFIASAFAHSGRTDGSGGHYNRSIGEYHSHEDNSFIFWLIVIVVVLFIVFINSGKKSNRK